MTLQQTKPQNARKLSQILCYKCGAEVIFHKDHVGPSGRKIPLDPYFNNEPHAQHCMYYTAPNNPDLEPLIFDFLSKILRRKQIIGAVGRARN